MWDVGLRTSAIEVYRLNGVDMLCEGEAATQSGKPIITFEKVSKSYELFSDPLSRMLYALGFSTIARRSRGGIGSKQSLIDVEFGCFSARTIGNNWRERFGQNNLTEIDYGPNPTYFRPRLCGHRPYRL